VCTSRYPHTSTPADGDLTGRDAVVAFLNSLPRGAAWEILSGGDGTLGRLTVATGQNSTESGCAPPSPHCWLTR
jgi:hypothetical protein